ncbi:DUF5680 domain-containing protein [Bradyrhizobium sp. 170]|uniref:DUF5680 domain-containing protein n=1 Tax=Bradyrhizobium sp. 170 TaxID=2782641 RepID=UPI001FFE92F8|nr:DUF5680 domain-containing protein [Bradyrhizobium sp. 170]UPK03681.1 hypothetical protein IVB05_40405 [Bradyrhizobium sp. 170]
MSQISLARLSEFLVDAKRKTYAGLDDDATVLAPLLPGSRQLEYRDLDLSYRDIYFGMRFFVGQETVLAGAGVVWSMSYAGGVAPTVVDRNEFLSVYAFLRQALLAIRGDRPFRGPPQFENESFRYVNTSSGDVAEFYGEEQIHRAGIKVYGLRYGGGLLR